MTSISTSLQRLYDIHNSKKTLLEVTYQERNENFYSNILAFFLKPNEVHKLGITVLKRLVEKAYPEFEFTEDNTDSVYVGREFYTKKGRIDFFVHTKKYVIGIENKIDHTLKNPLADYNTTLVKYANGNKEVRRILLSIKTPKELVENTEYELNDNKIIVKGANNETHEWRVITYNEFFEQLLKDNYLGNSRYYDYLEQLIRSISNLSKKDRSEKELTNSQKELKQTLELKEPATEFKKWIPWNDPLSIGCSIYYRFKEENIQIYAYIEDSQWYVGIQLDGDVKSGKISLKLFQLLEEKSGDLPNYEYTGNGRVGKHISYSSKEVNKVADELLRLKQVVEDFLLPSHELIQNIELPKVKDFTE
jgi:hypothetical protein